MTTQIQPPQAMNWQERLKDSSWVTIGWEWLQVLPGRSVDFVLWTTMIFSCYQLIPGAPQAPAGVSTFMFILQFIALDIGGLGLNRLAQQQGLPRWAYARVVAYILIGITLVTISYAGIEHAVTVPLEVTGWIEAMLVIARSIMTVLYGQAIHSLKAQEQSMRDHLAELEEQVTLQQEQLESGQQEVSSLRVQLNTLQQRAFSGQQHLSTVQQEVDTLRVQLNTEQGKVSSLQEQLDSGQRDASTLRTQLNVALVEVDTLRAQLDGKKQELESLRETFSSGQEWQESRVRQMVETERQRVSNLQRQLTDEQNAVVGLRRELNAALVEADRLRTQMEVKQHEVEGVQAVLKTEQQEVSSLRVQLDTLQQRAFSSGVQLDNPSSGQGKVDSGQGKVVRLDTNRPRKSGQDAVEHALAEQIRGLLTAEPGLSGRALAARLGCSPTTAAKWKGIIETERDAVNQ